MSASAHVGGLQRFNECGRLLGVFDLHAPPDVAKPELGKHAENDGCNQDSPSTAEIRDTKVLSLRSNSEFVDTDDVQ